MADLRLKGRALATVRMLAEQPTTRKMLWNLVSKDFHIDDLDALPASALGKVEEVPAPVQGAAPRMWGDGEDLGVPQTNRCTGHKLREAFAAGETTPTEVTKEMFGRLDRSELGEATFSPFVCIDRRVAEAAARESTARWSDGEPLSALDGLPVPIKDEFHMFGLPTTGGTSWRNHTEMEDATVVRLLREAGAVLPGKSTVTENGMNPLGFNPFFDMPRNVYSREHAAGGSSNGSGVAVGLGLTPVALGTDGGGSIRLPAAMNGVFGLKPTFNRVSGVGDIWLGTVGHPGPIGQSVSDLVDFMECATGFDAGDPFTSFAPDWEHVKSTWRPAIGRGVEGCRIGVLRGELADADPVMAMRIDEVLRELEREGAILVDVEIDHLRIVNSIGPLIIAGDSAANASSDQEIHRDETSEELRLVYALMQMPTAPLYLRASRARTGIRLRTAAALAGVDVLAMPTHARFASPYPISENREQVADTAWTASMTRFAFLGNLTGLPSLSTPIGMHRGLPMSMQFIGDAWDEASVIAVAAHVERIGITQLPLPPGYIDYLG